jgi:hypothetical protein
MKSNRYPYEGGVDIIDTGILPRNGNGSRVTEASHLAEKPRVKIDESSERERHDYVGGGSSASVFIRMHILTWFYAGGDDARVSADCRYCVSSVCRAGVVTYIREESP